MTDELHFDVKLEEGERHPSDGHELRLLAAALERIEILLEIQTCLLRDLLEQNRPRTYPKPTAGTVTVS